jgi:hypothetical protein
MASSTHPSRPAGAADAEPGWRVARVACRRASAAFGTRLISVYAIGSLTHGGFAPAVSDIDVAVLVDRCDESVPPLVRASVRSAQEQLGPGLADRLSIFYGDWESFGAPPAAARLGAIDRLDLIEHGVLMQGVDRRARNGVRPTRDELVAETADFLAYWETQRRDPDELIAAGARTLTKNVLFPVRCLYTHATGRAGANQDAVNWYREQGGPHADLAQAALDWRSGDVEAVVARALLERHLDGLYAECRRAFGTWRRAST